MFAEIALDRNLLQINGENLHEPFRRATRERTDSTTRTMSAIEA
jgi:hypothetical protein